MYKYKAQMRLVLAAKEKEMPQKNTRRIGAIINDAIADLDEILIANDINSLPDGPIKVAYESILAWATSSMEKVEDEKAATKLASSIRALVSKVRKPMEALSKMNSQIIAYEESILALLAAYDIKPLASKGAATEKGKKEEEAPEAKPAAAAAAPKAKPPAPKGKTTKKEDEAE